jgi:hypothetical protein
MLDKKHGLKKPLTTKDRSGHWEVVVDSAILKDLSHALYGDKAWRDTTLYTAAEGKHSGDLRGAAIYLDFHEQAIVNTLASHLVCLAHTVAKQQPANSPTENLCEIFDLAINFIMYLALKLYETDPSVPLTNKEFSKFLDSTHAYHHGHSPIFKPDTVEARKFLLTTYKLGTACDMKKPYFGGHELHLYMGPRRIFGKLREHTLRDELLKDLGLSALTKEARIGNVSGPLDELDANYIHSGPFRLVMSDHIQDHLTFRVDGRIVVYNFKNFDYIVLYRNCIAEYSPFVPTDTIGD